MLVNLIDKTTEFVGASVPYLSDKALKKLTKIKWIDRQKER